MCSYTMTNELMITCCRSSSVNGRRVETWNITSWPSNWVNTECSPVWSLLTSKPPLYLKIITISQKFLQIFWTRFTSPIPWVEFCFPVGSKTFQTDHCLFCWKKARRREFVLLCNKWLQIWNSGNLPAFQGSIDFFADLDGSPEKVIFRIIKKWNEH